MKKAPPAKKQGRSNQLLACVELHGLPYRVLTEGSLDLPSEKIGLKSGAFWLA